MGVCVPVTIFFFLGVDSLTRLFGLSVILFLGWALTDFFATVLSRPRLRDRSPGNALKEWDRQQDTDSVDKVI